MKKTLSFFLIIAIMVGCIPIVLADNSTEMGKGVSIMENNPNWHFKLPGRKELKVFKEELEISDSELE